MNVNPDRAPRSRKVDTQAQKTLMHLVVHQKIRIEYSISEPANQLNIYEIKRRAKSELATGEKEVSRFAERCG